MRAILIHDQNANLSYKIIKVKTLDAQEPWHWEQLEKHIVHKSMIENIVS